MFVARRELAAIRADAEPGGLGRADPSQAGCGGDYGCAAAYLSWPGGVKLYDPSHAQVAAHVTVTFAWNPLNRPVPPVNVSDAETRAEVQHDVAVGIVVTWAIEDEVAVQVMPIAAA